MTRLPVIVGFGGINSAGRVSCNHAYKRLVIDALPEAERRRTYRSLAALMQLGEDATSAEARRRMEEHTLIRRIELFDPDAVRCNREVSLKAAAGPLEFLVGARQMPRRLPEGWRVEPAGERDFKVVVEDKFKALLADGRVSRVSSAAQLPTGFDPVPFDLSAYFLKRLDLRTIFGAQDEPGLGAFREALRLIAEGEIDMSPYVTHALPLRQAADAFALAREPAGGALKVSLTM